MATPTGTPNPASSAAEAAPSSAAPAAAAAARVAQQVPAKQQTWWSSFIHSGSRRHVALGLLVFGGVAVLPWMLMKSDQPVSHEDYQELAEKARKARLSTTPSALPPSESGTKQE